MTNANPNRPPPAPREISREAWNRLTDFQRRVYRTVCRIPAGQTRSYRWVAERLGRPAAARAVGQALHRNPFAPLVPCHRVIRSDGSLGGFAGGVAKKRRLLEAERPRCFLSLRPRKQTAGAPMPGLEEPLAVIHMGSSKPMGAAPPASWQATCRT
ncbi:MAG: MGMT family protein [Candidatus Omnitrophota bacterium]|nr:MGMT family protein [Candidatus Omnitrophota bacterium]